MITALKNGNTRSKHVTHLCPSWDLNPSPALGRLPCKKALRELTDGCPGRRCLCGGSPRSVELITLGAQMGT